MTFDESANLMNDAQFKGRIKVAALKYSAYIHGEAPSTDGHSARYRWAQAAYQNPEYIATQVQPPVVMDDAVQQSGSAIDDDSLYMAVQRVVNQFI